jgi:hypothetical protein
MYKRIAFFDILAHEIQYAIRELSVNKCPRYKHYLNTERI